MYEFSDSEISGGSEIPNKCIKKMYFLIFENSFNFFEEGIFFFVREKICSHSCYLIVAGRL